MIFKEVNWSQEHHAPPQHADHGRHFTESAQLKWAHYPSCSASSSEGKSSPIPSAQAPTLSFCCPLVKEMSLASHLPSLHTSLPEGLLPQFHSQPPSHAAGRALSPHRLQLLTACASSSCLPHHWSNHYLLPPTSRPLTIMPRCKAFWFLRQTLREN